MLILVARRAWDEWGDATKKPSLPCVECQDQSTLYKALQAALPRY